MAFPLSVEALLQSEVLEDALYKDEGLCVLGIFGKSGMQPVQSKESLINTLVDKQIFPLFAGPDETNGNGGCLIQTYYIQESRVLYLVLTSSVDNRQLLRACESLSAGISHSDAHELWKGMDKQHCLHLLYLFSLCHVLLLVHPNCTFDVTYDRLFRALDALRQKVLPLIRAAIKDSPVSKEWKVNCRPCPPRLLFVFQMNGALRNPSFGGNGAETGAGNPDKPKKHSPRRRLQHALEDQIYRIFRKSRVLTNQSSNCLFTVPANQAFVYVLPGPDEDPVGALLGHLRAICTLREQDSGGALLGPRRYQHMRRSARQPCFGVEAGSGAAAAAGGQLVDCSLKEFLWQHVELVLTKKGFDDSVGRNPQPSHFELPTYSVWAHVAARLRQVLLRSAAAGAAGSAVAKEAEEGEEEAEELSDKVQGQLKVLEGFLDADAKFSESRCQKALPLAHSAYQAGLPHNYTTGVHKSQLAHALRVYGQHARGVAFQRGALQLHEDCYAFWSSGHQLCEERSLSDQHCVHKFHLLPQPGEKPDIDRNPPILHHNSRGRSTSSCNCGRKQAPREDPFDIRAANYDFYQMLEEKCCGKMERIQFPVFQPSTPDPAPRPRSPTPAPTGVGEAKGEAELEAEGEEEGDDLPREPAADSSATVAVAPHPAGTGHTPAEGTGTGLSLALSLGQSTGSLGPYADGGGGGGPAQHKRPSLAERQPSTVEYLLGMVHSGSPKGLLPTFSSWSLVRLGPAKAYNHHAGLEQPGFLPGCSFLLPWDLVVRQRPEEDGGGGAVGGEATLLDGGCSSSWPAPNKTVVGKRGVGVGGGVGRDRRRDDVARAFVGFEYEDGRGRRFISSGPDKVAKALGPGGVREPASRVLNVDMPLYTPSPAQGRGPKPHYAQLARLFVVVPDGPLEVILSPQVQPGPPPCPVFHPERTDLLLPPDGLWVLRFPYAYVTERGPCGPPKDNQPLASYKVLRGILRCSTTDTPAQ